MTCSLPSPIAFGPNTRYGDIAAALCGQPFEEMVTHFYRTIGRAQAGQHEAFLNTINTPEAWQDARTHFARMFHDTIGQSVPTHLVVHRRDTLHTPDLEIQKLLFSSMEDHWVTANLYLPRSRKPGEKLPAIISACGHAETGKANFALRAATLALNGYATLVIDPVGQGERRILHPAAASVQHNCIGTRFVLADCNLAWFLIHDNFAAVTLLQQHEAIDPDRIGMTGSSGGGWLTVHAAALDPRIKVIAPAAAVRTYRQKIHIDDAEQTLPDMQRNGLDFPALLGLLICPRPAFIVANEKDIWAIESTQDAYHTARRFYDMQGKADLLQMQQWNRGHNYDPDQLAVAIAWFNKHLAGAPDKPVVQTVEPHNVLAPQQTHVTPTGNLYDDIAFKTPNRVFWDHVRPMLPATPDTQGLIAHWHSTIQQIRTSTTTRHAPVSPIEIGRTARGQRIAFESEQGIILPMDMIKPTNAKSVAVVLDELAHRQGIHRTTAMLAQGVAVCRPDLRGLGQTQLPDDWPDRESLASATYSGKYRGLHALALTVGRDLVLDRVIDLMAALDVVSHQWPELSIELHASTDPQVIVALIAAILDTRITALKLSHHLQSLHDVMASDAIMLDGSSFVRGILRWGVDLPDLISACPCPIKTNCTHDAMLQPLHATTQPSTCRKA